MTSAALRLLVGLMWHHALALPYTPSRFVSADYRLSCAVPSAGRRVDISFFSFKIRDIQRRWCHGRTSTPAAGPS
ncbi:hypothetical protein OG21DRAFT_1503719 [Imleria badia]|nr:hypothetical protein OG21DRAFT_1503719 [Imleria badia]